LRYWLGNKRFVALALTLLCLVVAFVLLLFRFLALVLASPPPASPPHSIPNTDVNPYGANFFLHWEVEAWKRERTVKMAREAGIGWAKLHFPWEELEPEQKGVFRTSSGGSSWDKYDQIVELCERYGLQIIARLDRPPPWTRKDNTVPEAPPDNFEDYGDFVHEFVKHYKGRIRYIQIWNEPNIHPEWGNRPVDPAGYVELLKIAYRRAKEADPNVYVLSAPLAITLGEPHPEPGKWRSMNDLQFLEEMYKAGAKDYFDILSANAFGMDRPPDDPPDPQVLNFSRVVLQREIMEKYGDSDKPIWFNEYGWNAAPDDLPPEKLRWKRVSEEEQALYTVQGIEMARQLWPWAGVFNIWYFRQVGNFSPEHPEYYFRMVDVDFTPRPVYYAVKEATAGIGVAGPGYYEETNPAVSADAGWEGVIEPQASAKALLVGRAPGANLTFTFHGEMVDLIAKKEEGAGRLLVTLDGHPVKGLPRDAKGRSYVNLAASTTQWRVRVPLVRRTTNRQHVLRLTVEGNGPVFVDAFEVRMAPTPSFPWELLLLALGIGTDGWLLWREARRMPWRRGRLP